MTAVVAAEASALGVFESCTVFVGLSCICLGECSMTWAHYFDTICFVCMTAMVHLWINSSLMQLAVELHMGAKPASAMSLSDTQAQLAAPSSWCVCCRIAMLG